MQSTGTEFEHIKPPAAALQVTHDSKYIKQGEGRTAIRRILYKVPFDEFEENQLKLFDEHLKKLKIELPVWWNRQEALRWLYCQRFDLPKCTQTLQNFFAFLKDERYHKWNETIDQILKTGVIYTYGRDKQFRPILIVDVEKLMNAKFPMEDFIQALIYFTDVVKYNCFLPGHVETWTIIIETNNMSVWSLPIRHIQSIINVTQMNYPQYLNKMFILKPSFIISTSWSMIKGLLDPETATKIQFLKEDDMPNLLNFIPKDQLEQRFGGSLPNLQEFWPPTSTFHGQIVTNNNPFDPTVKFNVHNYVIKTPFEDEKGEASEINQIKIGSDDLYGTHRRNQKEQDPDEEESKIINVSHVDLDANPQQQTPQLQDSFQECRSNPKFSRAGSSFYSMQEELPFQKIRQQSRQESQSHFAKSPEMRPLLLPENNNTVSDMPSDPRRPIQLERHEPVQTRFCGFCKTTPTPDYMPDDVEGANHQGSTCNIF